jgi:hypothetical protein
MQVAMIHQTNCVTNTIMNAVFSEFFGKLSLNNLNKRFCLVDKNTRPSVKINYTKVKIFYVNTTGICCPGRPELHQGTLVAARVSCYARSL